MTVALLFPGQGSQTLGMLGALAAQYAVIQQTFMEASDILEEDFWDLSQQGPVEKINQTIYTQPLLLTAGVAVWRLCQSEMDLKPHYVAGHSLGEYTALVAAGVIDFSDALQLVRLRATCMQEAVPSGVGAMAAIVGLSENEIESICAEATQNDEIVSPANYNAPDQIVVAGHLAAVGRAMALAENKNARLVKQLPMSVPSHCGLLAGAASRLAKALETVTFHMPTDIQVMNNVDVAMPSDPLAIKAALVRQLFSPVRWSSLIQRLAALGVDLFIESGPQKILTGLNKRIVPALKTVSLNTPDDLKTLSELLVI